MDTLQIARIRPHTTNTQRAYTLGWDWCAKMKQLAMREKAHEIIGDIRKQFKIAKKYQFNKLAGEFATYLQYYYYINGDKHQGKKYSALAMQYSELSHLENVGMMKFAALAHKINTTRNPGDELIEELKATCEEFRTYLKYDSTILWMFTYTLLNVLASIKEDNKLIIAQSYEVINYLEEKGIERSAHFYKDIAYPLICEGRYKEAVVAINKAITQINKGSYSWSLFVYYRVIVELHRKDYQRAFEIFQYAEKKRHINKAMAETWRIVKGYMRFLAINGKIESSGHFKLGKFLNDTEIFSKDKSGQNINIIILKIILRLDSDRGRIIDERQAVQLYAQRYLEEGSRPRIFFQMLHQIVGGDFRRDEVEDRTAEYVNPLPNQEGYDPGLEMVPFEDLWALVLEGLD